MEGPSVGGYAGGLERLLLIITDKYKLNGNEWMSWLVRNGGRLKDIKTCRRIKIVIYKPLQAVQS